MHPLGCIYFALRTEYRPSLSTMVYLCLESSSKAGRKWSFFQFLIALYCEPTILCQSSTVPRKCSLQMRFQKIALAVSLRRVLQSSASANRKCFLGSRKGEMINSIVLPPRPFRGTTVLNQNCDIAKCLCPLCLSGFLY